MKRRIEYKLNATITLIAFILFCLREYRYPSSSISSFLVKISIVMGIFWFIIGKCFARIIHLMADEAVESEKKEEIDRLRRAANFLDEEDSN